jgi:hypothetical protein
MERNEKLRLLHRLLCLPSVPHGSRLVRLRGGLRSAESVSYYVLCKTHRHATLRAESGPLFSYPLRGRQQLCNLRLERIHLGFHVGHVRIEHIQCVLVLLQAAVGLRDRARAHELPTGAV